MSMKPGDDLSALLSSYNDGAKPAPKSDDPTDAWLEKFSAHRAKVLRPTMEALGTEIEKAGHDFHVVQSDFRRGNRAIPDEATIRIVIYLGDEKTRTRINADRRPHLAFTTSHKKQVVQVTICDITSRGGTESKIGEFPIEACTDAFVREKFVALFKRLIATQGPRK